MDVRCGQIEQKSRFARSSKACHGSHRAPVDVDFFTFSFFYLTRMAWAKVPKAKEREETADWPGCYHRAAATAPAHDPRRRRAAELLTQRPRRLDHFCCIRRDGKLFVQGRRLLPSSHFPSSLKTIPVSHGELQRHRPSTQPFQGACR